MKNLLILSFFILFPAMFLTSGCGEQDLHQNSASMTQVKLTLPNESKNFKSVGNNWYTFEFEGKKFLYRVDLGSYRFCQYTITKIK